jgi:Alkylmercury lyase
VQTSFKVHANDRMYFANCAWDSLGIPAALHTDAEIEASCAQSGESIGLSVKDQKVQGSDALVHFLIPFREWYDDLTFT